MSIIDRDLDMAFELTPCSAEELIPTGVRHWDHGRGPHYTVDAWSLLCPTEQLPDTWLDSHDAGDSLYWRDFHALLALDQGSAVLHASVLRLRDATQQFGRLWPRLRDGGEQ